MHEVFISFDPEADNDVRTAKWVRDCLTATGLPCFLTTESIPEGSDYMQTVPKAIDSARFFVLIISEKTQKSNNVLMELDRAVKVGCTVLPLVIEDCPMTDSFRFLLAGTPQFSAFKDKKQAVRSLIARIYAPDSVLNREALEEALDMSVDPMPKADAVRTVVRRVGRTLTALGLVCLAGILFWNGLYLHLNTGRAKWVLIILLCIGAALLLSVPLLLIFKRTRRLRMVRYCVLSFVLLLAAAASIFCIPHRIVNGTTLLFSSPVCFVQNYSFPKDVTMIGNGAFYDWRRNASVTIPDGVTEIGAYAFADSLITEIVIPDSVTKIGAAAFLNCRSLTRIRLPASLETISDSTFGNCSSLESIDIPETVTSIGDAAFENCSSLKRLIIPDHVTSVGDRALHLCTSLQSLKIGRSVTTIGKATLAELPQMRRFYVDPDNAAFAVDEYGVLFSKDYEKILRYPSAGEWTEYTVPDTVKMMDEFCFTDQIEMLKTIRFPNGLVVDETGWYFNTSDAESAN